MSTGRPTPTATSRASSWPTGFRGSATSGCPPTPSASRPPGLAALLFDYRHFGRSAASRASCWTSAASSPTGAPPCAYARGLDGIDGARIALWGSSFAGGHVLCLAAEGVGVAAIVAQVPFCDGLATLLTGPPRDTLRGTLYGLADRALALVGAGPLLIPAVGPPGSFAVMTAGDAAIGMAAIVAPQSRWRNAVAARVMLHVARYRPGATADRITAPVLICVADRDETTPPGPAVAAAERAPRGELVRYAVGHFHAYEPAHREQLIADQLRFLGRHLLGAPARGARRGLRRSVSDPLIPADETPPAVHPRAGRRFPRAPHVRAGRHEHHARHDLPLLPPPRTPSPSRPRAWASASATRGARWRASTSRCRAASPSASSAPTAPARPR